MKELALHILDIVENSIRASAKIVTISIIEETNKDLITIEIIDDGCGMDADTLNRALNPFFTTKTVRRVGMGLSLWKSAAERANGSFELCSKPGIGTRVKTCFERSHIDRQPLGNIASTIVTVLLGNPDLRIVYRHNVDKEEFIFDSDVVKSELDGVPFSHPDVIAFINELIESRTGFGDL